VSPKEGSVEGGTRLTIRGSNLGRNKEDVIGLYVCGSNVLSSLEYVSASKLVCTTKAHKPCVGNVTVETQVGGRGVSLVQFTFNDPAAAASSSSSSAAVRAAGVAGAGLSVVAESYSGDSTSECSSSLSRSSSRGDADVKRTASIKVQYQLSLLPSTGW